jgi:lysophospholipase L1-like esterase
MGSDGTPPGMAAASVAPAAGIGDAAKPSPETVASAPAPAAAPVPDTPATPELPRGTTVLHIGDSFAGALGIDLNVLFKAAGVRGILRYETATYIPTWAFGKQIDQYLGQFNPDLVIVTLGANELEIVNPADRTPTIHRLVARLRGRSCVWVGPPLWKGARPALLDTIKSECAPCLYLDSNLVAPDLPRARDHIHPSTEARKTWAKAVLGWLAEHRTATAESTRTARRESVRAWDLTP